MKLTDKGGGDFDPAPAGSHIARCVSVIDLGTQNWMWQNKPQRKRKIRLGFELPFETKVFDEQRGPEPLFVSGEFTASLNERATLRGLLSGWRGRDFTPEELEGFESRNLLDKPCMLSLVHEKKDGGKVYANINAISKLPNGPQFVCPPAKSELIYLSLEPEEFDPRLLQKLPDWVRDKIMKSEEYIAMNGGGADESQDRRDHGNQGGAGNSAPAPDDDEIPF